MKDIPFGHTGISDTGAAVACPDSAAIRATVIGKRVTVARAIGGRLQQIRPTIQTILKARPADAGGSVYPNEVRFLRDLLAHHYEPSPRQHQWLARILMRVKRSAGVGGSGEMGTTIRFGGKR